MDFKTIFKHLTSNPPFPWQERLYEQFISDRPDNIPSSCSLPTGLGKTSVVAVWLIALANHRDKVPRRLVYVVNRRTVVDQTTVEVENYRRRLVDDPALAEIRKSLAEMCALPLEEKDGKPASPLALSTLRGQFADNREWSADPARPAVIVGTVDMIGSRLLFSGYGVGFKGKPLHAGFLGQDVLLVHDEAHLEPAFQTLLVAIEEEQKRCNEFRKFRVMELSATSRGGEKPFELTDEEKTPPDDLPENPTEPIHFVWRRQQAKKALFLRENNDPKKLADEVGELALKFKDSNRAVLVFVRKVEDVEKIVTKLTGDKQTTQQLTGTLRGLERDRMADPTKENGCPIFARFLRPPKPDADTKDQWKVKPHSGTVYLVCTSAGEVGVNISADHLICDLSTFESMAQRFGRVNRFGDRNDSEIHVVYPKEFEEANEFDERRRKTLDLMIALKGDGSPKSLNELNASDRIAAFAPTPVILPTSDILFDAWALTTIRNQLPGRPPVEPYLHGISGWEPPETQVAWREEVDLIQGSLVEQNLPAELLDDYPLKPHELLRDNSGRVYDRIKKLTANDDTPVWLMSDDEVKVMTLKLLIEAGKEELNFKTILLPPSAGGLQNGLLTPTSNVANDVSDQVYDKTHQRRMRVRGNDARLDELQKSMRLVRTINLNPEAEEKETESPEQWMWFWYERSNTGDSDGSKTSRLPVAWDVHTSDVTLNVERIVNQLPLHAELKAAVIVAARLHDLGKRRVLWQRSIGNPNPTNWLAKSGGDMKPRELGDTYRHEFGSLMDVYDSKQAHQIAFRKLSDDMKDIALHLIAAHHGFGRPHFPIDAVFDPEPRGTNVESVANAVPTRFSRLQRKYGRWGLAYLESLLRAADYAASANPSAFTE